MDQTTLEHNIQHYLWLRYFNDTLRAQGVITEREYQKMNRLIWSQYPITQK